MSVLAVPAVTTLKPGWQAPHVVHMPLPGAALNVPYAQIAQTRLLEVVAALASYCPAEHPSLVG